MRSSDVRDELVLMELSAPHDHRLEQRNADAAADIAQQVDGAGYLAAFFLRDADISGGVDWNEQQREAERLELAIAGSGVEVELQIQTAGYMEQRYRAEHQSADDKPTSLNPPHQYSDDWHQHDHQGRAGRLRHPGQLRGIAHERLHILRREHGDGIDFHSENEDQQSRGGEVAITKQPQVHHRFVPRQLPCHEQHHGHGEDHGQCRDHVGVEPVILLTLVEHHLEGTKAEREQADSDVIDAEVRARLARLFDQV